MKNFKMSSLCGKVAALMIFSTGLLPNIGEKVFAVNSLGNREMIIAELPGQLRTYNMYYDSLGDLADDGQEYEQFYDEYIDVSSRVSDAVKLHGGLAMEIATRTADGLDDYDNWVDNFVRCFEPGGESYRLVQQMSLKQLQNFQATVENATNEFWKLLSCIRREMSGGNNNI